MDRGVDYVLAVITGPAVRGCAGPRRNSGEGVPHANKGHGRIERRECWAISDLASLEYLRTGQEWPQLRSVVKVTGRRETPEEATVQPRYYISSLEASAQRLLETVRRHWSIENGLHWSLDVTFGEDQCRVRKDHAPQNMAMLRQVAHNLLKREKSLKAGIKTAASRLAGGLKSPPQRDCPARTCNCSDFRCLRRNTTG